MPRPVPTERNAKSSTPRATPLPLLAERSQVDVVLERHREPEPVRRARRRAHALELEERAARLSRPVGVDDARHADDRRVDRSRPAPAASISASRTGRSRRAPPRRSDRAARRPGGRGSSPTRSQTAPRRKRAPRSRPSTSAASGTGSKKTRPVARPVGVVLGLAHEAGLEQRLQRERDGRLRDPGAARDLGARDRRAGAGSPPARCAR